MISQTTGTPATTKSWNSSLMNVFNSAASAAKDVFNFQDDPIEGTQSTRPGLFPNFSKEIRMLQYSLGGITSPQTPVQKELLNYALKLIESCRRGDKERFEQNLYRVKKVIAMMLFLAERNMAHLEEIVNTIDPKNYQSQFSEFFTSNLSIRILEARLNKETQSVTHIANAKHGDVPTQTEIAKIVVTSSGLLNTAILPEVMKEFNCAGQDNVYSYEQLIEDIASDEQLSTAFDAILSPENEDSISYDLIRSIVGLNPEQSVSQAHAKQAVLAALMAMFCHKRYNSKEKLHTYMHHMICFCCNLLRTEQGFSFDYMPEDPKLSVEFILHPNGILNDTSISFWNHPAVQAIAKILQIRDLSDFWNEIKKHIFVEEEPASVKMHMHDVISVMVHYAMAKNPSLTISQQQDLHRLAKFAFSSIHSNPLVDLTLGFMKNERAKLDRVIFDVAIRRILRKPPVDVDANGQEIQVAVQRLISHGTTVADHCINDTMRKQMYSFFDDQTMIPDAIREVFAGIVDTYDDSMIKNFKQHPVSVKDYALKLLTLADDLNDATPIERYNNRKAMSVFLLTKGLDQKLRDGLWELAPRIEIPNTPYDTLGVSFYLMYDLLGDRLVQISSQNKRTHVEILESNEWDQVNALA